MFRLRGGCVPLLDNIDDFADFVNMLLIRFGDLLQHFIVWNEVASALWMNMQPEIPVEAGPGGSNPLTQEQVGLWVGRYASLMRAVAVTVSCSEGS